MEEPGTVGREDGVTGVGVDEPLPVGSIVTSRPPTLTFSPTAAWILVTRPLFGDGISTLALSVRTLTRGASSATESPSWTNHFTTSPSATPSPISGSRNS